MVQKGDMFRGQAVSFRRLEIPYFSQFSIGFLNLGSTNRPIFLALQGTVRSRCSRLTGSFWAKCSNIAYSVKKSVEKKNKNARISRSTPPKTNMEPENWWLEDVFPIEIVPF